MLGITAMMIGVSMTIIAWSFFRRPGVGFGEGPKKWRTPWLLTPVGAFLWILGHFLVVVGFLFFIYELTRFL